MEERGIPKVQKSIPVSNRQLENRSYLDQAWPHSVHFLSNIDRHGVQLVSELGDFEKG
jgi:hypothetical protein